MIFRKPKPPIMAVVPADTPDALTAVLEETLDAARDCDDAIVYLPRGVTILQCVNGEWIPLPIPEPEADEPPPSRRTLA